MRMSEAALLARLTSLRLALPEAAADDRHPPHRGFVVNKKNFAWFTVDEHGDGRVALGVRAGAKENEMLVASDSERFGLPKLRRSPWMGELLPRSGGSSGRLGRGHRTRNAIATGFRLRNVSHVSSTTEVRA